MESPEVVWGAVQKSGAGPDMSWLIIGCLVLLVIGGLTIWISRSGEDLPSEAQSGSVVEDDGLLGGLEDAQEVAKAFLEESDPAKRLRWVRNAEEVKDRLAEYQEEARAAVGKIEKVLGHRLDDGRSVTGFVVVFPSGNMRLLEVVGTSEGPRVDWDAYARHGTATWDDLLSGEAKGAVVRVFCEPSSERPAPFADQSKWTCFRLSSPDLPQAVLGFSKVGSPREEMMKRVVLSTPNYRQRFVLEIERHEGEDEPLFEITQCHAVGWIQDEQKPEKTSEN